MPKATYTISFSEEQRLALIDLLKKANRPDLTGTAQPLEDWEATLEGLAEEPSAIHAFEI